MVDLSIIIVSYNARIDLQRCLASLHTPPPTTSHEIIVVDNHSRDDSAGAARQYRDVTVLETDSNLGFARATNVGIRAASGNLLLFLNSDTLVPAGAIDRLVDVLTRHPEAAVAGPRLVDGQGRAELSFGPMVGPLNELRQKLLSRGHAARLPLVTPFVERSLRRMQRPAWVSGACLMVRREDAQAVGLLDERYFMYTEDVDFCAAIRARRRTVLFTPDVEIVHLRGRSVSSDPEATRLAYRQSHLAFYQKHHPAWAPLLRLYLNLRGEL
jgi:N-acetylglucosaminyl-diphospho-decaprenol L-rhamnosyltransferase